jgi:surface glycoprotein (TIGR04207 family)
MKLRAFALSVLIVLSVLAVGVSFGAGTAAAAGNQVDVAASDLPGSGNSGNPYNISNASELQAMEDNRSAHYQLVENIDASGTSEWDPDRDGTNEGFDPIGYNAENEFTGTFDGNGHTIANLTIQRASEDTVGLFGSNSGTVTNVRLVAVNIS